MFARIDSLWTHYFFYSLYRRYDLFLENSSMDLYLYRNDLFSLIRNTAPGVCVEGWHRRAFNMPGAILLRGADSCGGITNELQKNFLSMPVPPTLKNKPGPKQER